MGGRFYRNTTGGNALEMLERSHHRLQGRMTQLVAAATAWATTKDPQALDTAREVCTFLQRATRRHEQDEEQSVFPRLPHTKELQALTTRLTAEHREHEHQVETLANLLQSPPSAQALLTVATKLKKAYDNHIATEDAQLKPYVSKLPTSTLYEIYTEMQSRRGRKHHATGQR